MKTDGSLYYSSLPNEAPQTGKAQTTPTRRKDAQPSPSPRKTIESASSSISNAVVTSVNSARKIKDRARSFVPKKLFPVPSSKTKRGGLDEVTPVIFYRDEDAVTKRDGTMTFVDPFSFGDSKVPGDQKNTHDDFNSPTSVVPVRLFPEDSSKRNITSAAVTNNCKEGNDVFDEVVSFDCPIFTQDFNFNEGDTSIDFSEAIRSINALSIKEIKSFRESIRAKKEAGCESLDMWQDSMLPWDGFKRSASFTMCEWDPKSDDIVPFNSSNSHQEK
eukprot:CAMPEP_0201940662 /NCGR_PEP_ID=MMETSP0903-20130614/45633_1 /ASSEMBLY_ACC=CAM_ASM_000552 /TAXON_ID=420261 /ORGANISM="Thalassiosira antarctica, Strain CCMP982" /LENGTH=273 /DNA_ID=CAMNT_0048482515 /DNA_START=81 /DNA_END=902 /DNA_ORIENTATION=+